MPLQRGPDTPTNAITFIATGALACSFYAIPLPSFGDESCKSPAKPGGGSSGTAVAADGRRRRALWTFIWLMGIPASYRSQP